MEMYAEYLNADHHPSANAQCTSRATTTARRHLSGMCCCNRDYFKSWSLKRRKLVIQLREVEGAMAGTASARKRRKFSERSTVPKLGLSARAITCSFRHSNVLFCAIFCYHQRHLVIAINQGTSCKLASTNWWL